MKKYIVIITCIVVSTVVTFSNSENLFLIDTYQLVPLLLTVLGLCFASYTFLFPSVREIIKKNDDSKVLINHVKKVFISLEKDMWTIFYATLIILFLNVIKNYDIPFISNPENIDFNLFVIKSLKTFFINFSISLSALISFASLYDLLKSSFLILSKYFDN